MPRVVLELALLVGLVGAVVWTDRVCGRGMVPSQGLLTGPPDPAPASITVMDMTTGRTRMCQPLGAVIACH